VYLCGDTSPPTPVLNGLVVPSPAPMPALGFLRLEAVPPGEDEALTDQDLADVDQVANLAI
jgi:hypothetical protein